MSEEQLINRLTTLANSNEVIADNIKVDKNIFKETIKLIDKLRQENVELKMQLEVEKIDNKYNKEEASEEMIPRYKIRDKIKELAEGRNYIIVNAEVISIQTLLDFLELLGE